MNPTKILWAFAGIALIGLIVFAKVKACIDRDNGNARAVPWLFPCSSNEDAIKA